MAFNKTGIVCLFICLVIFDALAMQALATPIKLRGKPRPALRRDFGKRYAIQNKVLARKEDGGSTESKKPLSCNPAPKEGRHNDFCRTYETIGTCPATIDVVANVDKSVDYIATQCVDVQTLQNYEAQYNILTNVKANKRLVQPVCATIQVLKTVCATVETLVCESVTIDIVETQEACVWSVSERDACVQTLKPVEKNIRVIQPKQVCARKVRDAAGPIKVVKRVHQLVSQGIARSVTCKVIEEECPNLDGPLPSCLKESPVPEATIQTCECN